MEANLGNTLQRWGEARCALDHAIQNYLDRTTALQSALHSYSHSDGFNSVRSTLPKAWLDDIQVPADYSKLAEAQSHLNQIRNSFLSINALPLEILLRIFRFSAFRSFHTRYNTPVPNPFGQDNRRDLLALTHVCTHWRTVLLNARTFWARFEFNTKENQVIAGERARAYLDRAPDVPLSFCIARFDRLARMALTNFQEPRVARDIILFWMQNGKPGTLRALAIRMDTNYWYDEVVDTRSDAITRERVESFLLPIRVLYLNGLRFDWDSPVYHNLVVLRIGGYSENLSPQIHEMLAILSACPQLHTLQLHEMSIRPSVTGNLGPVYLTELENLGLSKVAPNMICLLLSVIFPRTKDLSLRIGSLHIDEKLVSASIHPFLTRTNVTRLFVQRCIDVQSDDISRYISALPNLHTLLISLDEMSGDKCLSAFTRADESNSAHIPLCPQLHTMYLPDGPASTAAIQQIVKRHPHIRKLRFSNCDITPSENELRCWLKPFVEDVRFDVETDQAETFDWYHLMD
ncbi:hypothetical protein RSAG8_06722, partial [Rhizoctonia solani AG-8 WAC10335]